MVPWVTLCQLAPSSKEERMFSCLRRSHVDGPANRMRLYLSPASVARSRSVDASTIGVIRSGWKVNFCEKVAPPSELIAWRRLRWPSARHLSSLLAWLRAAARTRPSVSSTTLTSCGLTLVPSVRMSVAPKCQVAPESSL